MFISKQGEIDKFVLCEIFLFLKSDTFWSWLANNLEEAVQLRLKKKKKKSYG